MKKLISVLVAALGLTVLAEYNAETAVQNSIRDVVVRQQWPWSSTVTVTFKVAGLAPTDAVDVTLTGTVGDESAVIPESVLTGAVRGLSLGEHTLSFNPTAVPLLAQHGTTADFNVRVTPSLSTRRPDDPLYMIVDLTTTENPVSFLSRRDILSGAHGTYETTPAWIQSGSTPALDDCLIWTGVTNDVYRTTKLVLRKIPADNTENLTDYWMAVFELTQEQYGRVMGSAFTSGNYPGEQRPVECKYSTIRGSVEGAKWPEGDDVDSDSLMGILQHRAKLPFDLPTNAQWEYASRAGTTTDLYSGKNVSDVNVAELARYANNQSAGTGGYTSNTTTVGSYKSNAWGLFDMYGNVWEWTRDLHSTGPNRIVRGGGCISGSSSCCSASSKSTSNNPSGQQDRLGIRVVVTTSAVAE